jgi:glycosyltransferase involved in cell wall biosynthesis
VRQKISVAIITLDEERRIRPCLESVTWADEIVICDSGSTDKTLEISREYTDWVYVDEWRGYGAQKNLAVERASSPWILSLDADERVTPELRKAIEEVLEHEMALDGYYIPRKNYFLGRWVRRCGWYPDYVLRLFRRGRGRFTDRAVHEAVRLEGGVGYLKASLDHYTYSSISDYLVRMDRYSTLGAEELRREGNRASLRDLLLRPPFTFVRMYLFQAGFLEGWRGFLLASLYAYYTFIKYAKLWEMSLQEGPEQGSGEPWPPPR